MHLAILPAVLLSLSALALRCDTAVQNWLTMNVNEGEGGFKYQAESSDSLMVNANRFSHFG